MGKRVVALPSPQHAQPGDSAADPSDPAGPRTSLGRVAVIGAGISGLAAAYRLQQEGADVTVFERAERVGGLILSQRGREGTPAQGFQWDLGANSMADDSPLVGQVIEDLRLEGQVAVPAQLKERYVVRAGKCVKLPSSPVEFVTTPLLSTQAKLRILAEPILWKRREGAPEVAEKESVRSFLERHIGREAVDFVVDPFCGGTSGASPDTLSMKHAFPHVWELEQEYGSLLVGALRAPGRRLKQEQLQQQQRQERGPSGAVETASISAPAKAVRKKRSTIFSFSRGMQSLPLVLAERVGPAHLRLGTTVQGLSCDTAHQPRPIWTVSFSPSAAAPQKKKGEGAGQGEREGEEQVALSGGAGASQSRGSSGKNDKAGKRKESSMRFDAVILTAPLPQVHQLKLSCGGKLWDPTSLQLPNYSPISVIVTAYPASAVKQPPSGFGVLVPSGECRAQGFSTLGTLFSSAMFPERAPRGYHLFTSFVGGRVDPSLPAQPTEKLLELVQRDLGRLVGAQGPPAFATHAFWKLGFPEYGIAYGETLRGIQKLETDHPFLYYAGNHCHGLAVGKTLTSGYEAAGRALADLRSHGGAKVYTMA